MIHVDASVEANDAAAPAANARRSDGDSPRAREPRPLQRARADDHRQRDMARQRVGVAAPEPAPARRGQRHPVARHPRRQRQHLRAAEHQRVDEPRVVARAVARPRHAVGTPTARPRPPRARTRSSPASRAAPRSPAPASARRSPAARTTRRSAPRRRRSNPRSASATSSLQADQQRRGRPGVQRDLERLAQVAVHLRVRPPQQPRHELGVSARGDRQQLRRPVQRAERERVAQRELRSQTPASTAGGHRLGIASVRCRRGARRRTISQMTPPTIATTAT